MPLTFDELLALPNGASFARADLHVHSAASYDVHDKSLTAAAIVDGAVNSGLEIIAITDHNTIANVRPALEHAADRYPGRILIVPGTEVTTPEGHLLAYFDPLRLDKLERFVMMLDIIDDHQGSRTSKSIVEVVKLACTFGGLCVAAHIDTGEGFEVGQPGFEAWKKDLICQPGLRGLEFRDSANRHWYSTSDQQSGSVADERRKYARERARTDGVPAAGALARFTNSDAHTRADLVATAHITRLKLTSPTFASFACALADPNSRVQIESGLPLSIPKIQGLEIEGGFLNGCCVHFAPNLNVFIGGRGTGKSTAIRALAFALGLITFQDSFPFDNVTVFCEDSSGVAYRFDRQAGQPAAGRIRQGGRTRSVGGDVFRVEYFSQGELSDVAKRSLLDRNALQAFLDRHIAFATLFDDEHRLSEEARELGRELAAICGET